MVRVVIAGSRSFNDYKYLEAKCHKVFYSLSKEHNILSGHILEDIPNMEIVSGNAKGADILGEMFASRYNIRVKRFYPNWDLYGKRAGYLRNKEMAEYATSDNSHGILIAFWDGKSKGTQHMINLAKENNLIVFVINYITDNVICEKCGDKNEKNI